MKRSTQNTWLIWLGAALVIVAMLARTPFDRNVAVGEYDGQENEFEVGWGNTTNVTEVNSLYALEVRVSNSRDSGSMYVRCRIVTRNTTWLPGNLSREASLPYLPTGGTCLNDAYGQTARADLDTGESILVPFTLITPNAPDLWAVSCMTIERCWQTNATDLRSDQKAFLLNITPHTGTPTPVNATYLCSLDQDCDAYNLFGPQRCISGRCVDRADIESPDEPDAPTDKAVAKGWARVKQWVQQHKTVSTLGIVALAIAGLYLLRRRKKK